MGDPREFAVTMGMDAFRIAIGIKPRKHGLADIIRWLTLMSATPSDASQADSNTRSGE